MFEKLPEYDPTVLLGDWFRIDILASFVDAVQPRFQFLKINF